MSMYKSTIDRYDNLDSDTKMVVRECINFIKYKPLIRKKQCHFILSLTQDKLKIVNFIIDQVTSKDIKLNDILSLESP